jgi:hypothetical protein
MDPTLIPMNPFDTLLADQYGKDDLKEMREEIKSGQAEM